VVSTADVPFTLAATIWLILNTSLDEAGFASNTTAVVADGVKKVVVPNMVVTLTMFGFAIYITP
jgi:hypothetical protein